MRNIVVLLLIALLASISLQAEVRKKYNFNPDWKLCVGDPSGAEQPGYDDASWKSVTLPHAFNEDDAFRVAIDRHTTGVAWYRKHFRLPSGSKGQKVFVEFEGVRQAGEFFINGTPVGIHENGVMAVGFDLTPYVRFGKENVIAVRIDNSWDYKEKSTGAKFQWSDRNFNANYGGIPKNVYLHLTGKLYQTLPLFSNLGTTGVYVYADSISVGARTANIHAELEVKNEHPREVTLACEVEVKDMEGALVGKFAGEKTTIASGETKTVKAAAPFSNLNFWSWGYGYLYTVETALIADGKEVDRVKTRTGFRKTRFANGMVWLNDRVIQLKGYAQRTSNEWPAVGLSVPAWLSDYSNGLMVESNANIVRWMHVTPWRQDVESCDRVGLMQAMPAGDAEKDVADARWQQRTRLMRDAIIYNRNSPSIIFYESGNESISEEHMAEMKAIRDRYDPCGGRAIGSREMLDSRVAEYGGEMLYINKSARIPMWATEYSRDEGLRKYWDSYSYPFHRDGEGPLYRGADASAYNRNQDSHAVENIVRWFDYWRERPGTGRRVSSGGAKIIFSDSNTHFRGAENYRRSGVTDPMRIPKDGFFAHQVMWDGWVDVEKPRTHIIGHWNYGDSVVKDVFVVSGGCQKVELLVNGASKGFGSKSHEFLYTFKNVAFESGELKALAYDAQGRVVGSDTLLTAGAPEAIRLTLMRGAHGLYADGADMALVEVEVVDGSGRRRPLANDEISFELSGPAEWRGGIAQGRDNCILSKTLPVECGVNRALIRSTPQAGQITLAASSGSLKPASVTFASTPVDNRNGLSETIQAEQLRPAFRRGATPSAPSYAVTRIPVEVKSATAGANSANALNSCDDNELSEWRNDGIAANGWIAYELEREAYINEVALKLTGWRMRSYPISIFADSVQVFSGSTEKSLGYVTIPVKKAKAKTITVRLTGSSTEGDAFGQVVELTGTKELDMYGVPDGGQARGELRIVEAEFYEAATN
jgi:hypothetical protein